MEATTYLAKAGKVSGPFDAKQIEDLKRSGDFYAFEWMWDGHSPDWAPVPRKLQAPPALPEVARKITHVSAAEAANAPVAKNPSFHGADIKTSDKTFCAVLFDTRITIGGEVSHAHSRGGKFVSTPTQQIPVSKGSSALLDLLDEATDRSTKVKAAVVNVSRMGERWVLDLEWAGMPLLD